MELNLSPDQIDIRDSVAAFLEHEVPFAAVQKMADADGVDDRTWQQCVELGWLGLGICEEAGGVGFGLAEEIVLAREIGRHLVPGPFLSTIIAAHLLEAAGASELLVSVLAGEERVGLWVDDLVVDGIEGGLAVRLGDDVASLTRIARLDPRPCADPTVKLGRGEGGDTVAEAPAGAVAAHAALLYAGASLGVAEFTMQQSVQYAKDRHQFGRPIGSFQAIKHRCADMAIRAYSAYAQLAVATISVDAGLPDAGLQLDSAVLLCLEAARLNAADNIQIHGGIGFTDEHSAGWYLKRAHVLEQLAGPRDQRTTRLIAADRMEFA